MFIYVVICTSVSFICLFTFTPRKTKYVCVSVSHFASHCHSFVSFSLIVVCITSQISVRYPQGCCNVLQLCNTRQLDMVVVRPMSGAMCFHIQKSSTILLNHIFAHIVTFRCVMLFLKPTDQEHNIRRTYRSAYHGISKP